MVWKLFLYYWPFVRGIYQTLVYSPHKGPVIQTVLISLLWAWPSCWTFSQAGPHLNMKMAFPGMGIFHVKRRWLWDHLILTPGIGILVIWCLYIEIAPGRHLRCQNTHVTSLLMCLKLGKPLVKLEANPIWIVYAAHGWYCTQKQTAKARTTKQKLCYHHSQTHCVWCTNIGPICYAFIQKFYIKVNDIIHNMQIFENILGTLLYSSCWKLGVVMMPSLSSLVVWRQSWYHNNSQFSVPACMSKWQYTNLNNKPLPMWLGLANFHLGLWKLALGMRSFDMEALKNSELEATQPWDLQKFSCRLI